MPQGSHGSTAVVGGRGFIGTHLVATLRDRGTRVSVLGRDAPPVLDGRVVPEVAEARTVFWAASSINPQIANDHPERVESDRLGLMRFLDALEDSGSPARVVLLSSGGTVYGDAPAPHAESTPPEPSSAYGRAKLELERLLAERRTGSTAVRIANAYGPGQRAAAGQGVVAHWLRAVLEHRQVTVFGLDTTLRDYIDVQDVADALSALHTVARPPAVVNIGSGRPTSLGELAQVVQEVVAPDALRAVHEPARPFDVAESWLDVRLAAETLAWRATTDLRTGVERTWRWVRDGDPVRQARATIT